jgi:hypothetical protein
VSVVIIIFASLNNQFGHIYVPSNSESTGKVTTTVNGSMRVLVLCVSSRSSSQLQKDQDSHNRVPQSRMFGIFNVREDGQKVQPEDEDEPAVE